MWKYIQKLFGGKAEMKPFYERERPPCPFYSFSYQGIIFMDSEGNQCGMNQKTIGPCYMELQGQKPSWTKCSLNRGPFGEKDLKAAEKIKVFPKEFYPPNLNGWGGISMRDWLEHILGDSLK
jgi:hypothetical protein